MVLIDLYLFYETQRTPHFYAFVLKSLIRINEMHKKGRAGCGSAFCFLFEK